MGFVFKRLAKGNIASYSGGLVFRKLSIDGSQYTPGLDSDNFNMKLIGLKAGTYAVTVTTVAHSLKLAESEHSDSIEYIVE